MADCTIDNSGNHFPGTTTIADLARFHFQDLSSYDMAIYFVDGVIDAAYPFEVEAKEYEYMLGVDITFKDGSRLYVCAHGEVEIEDGGRSERACYEAGRRYVQDRAA